MRWNRWFANTLPALGLAFLCAGASGITGSGDSDLARHQHCRSPGYTVTVTPGTLPVVTGDSGTLHAVVTRCGVVAPNVLMTWTPRNTAVVSAISSRALLVVAHGTAVGSTYVVGVSDGGGSDSSLVTVANAPPAFANGCPQTGYLRLVNVSTASGLTTAIGAALAGDQIRLAAGTYSLNDLTLSANGTQANRITLCGPRTAILTNADFTTFSISGDWWWLRGFQHTGGLDGIFLNGNSGDRASFSLLDSLDVSVSQNEAILFHYATHNTVQYSDIYNAGNTSPQFGECVYIGNGSTDADPSDSNLVQYNKIGPNCRAEHFDVKHGTRGNIIQYNVSDATGFAFISGNVTAIYITGGTGTFFTRDSVANVPAGSGSTIGFQVFNGDSNVYHLNHVQGSFGTAYRVTSGTGNVIYCDNTKNGAGAFGTTCTP